ncbi:MAG TPA: hypothetical protein VMU67_03655 [Steroidobacteraceae bacterium]|nr:hypothetical protein [Steroidobacteraceae bacterium]
MSTAWERFQEATLSLARSGPIKERLADAYRNFLADIAEDDLPREIRDEFRAVSMSLTRERPTLRGEDAVRATTRKMSNDEADRLACTVVRLFSAIPRVAPAARHAAAAQVVPLYLAETRTTGA